MHQYVRQFAQWEGKEVTVKGWVANIRDSKTNIFIVFRDGSGFAQCVVSLDTVGETQFELAKSLTQESSLRLSGTVVKDEKQIGGYEMHVNDLEVYQISTEYPITPKDHGVKFLSDNRHLWLRSQRQWAIMRIRNEIIMRIHTYFQDHGFIQMDSPIFTGNAVEGTSDLFETDFFGQPAFLAQSGQLYGEAMAMAQGKIYTFGPTFRAEKSDTPRHLSEFWMIEPEVAFVDIHNNMDLAEDLLQHVIRYALKNCSDDLVFLNQRLEDEEKQKPQQDRMEMGLLEKLEFVVANKFERITYTEAIDILLQSAHYKKKKFQYDVKWGIDLQSEHERFLVEKHFKKPVIVTGYPAKIKAFYMRTNAPGDFGYSDKGKTVAAMDVLFPGIGEIIGGSQREERLDVLEARMDEMGGPKDCLLYTSPSPRDRTRYRMPSSS